MTDLGCENFVAMCYNHCNGIRGQRNLTHDSSVRNTVVNVSNENEREDSPSVKKAFRFIFGLEEYIVNSISDGRDYSRKLLWAAIPYT